MPLAANTISTISTILKNSNMSHCMKPFFRLNPVPYATIADRASSMVSSSMPIRNASPNTINVASTNPILLPPYDFVFFCYNYTPQHMYIIDVSTNRYTNTIWKHPQKFTYCYIRRYYLSDLDSF